MRARVACLLLVIGAASVQAEPAPRVVRRLTAKEFDNSVRALLGLEGSATGVWARENGGSGFDNDVAGQVPSVMQVERFATTAAEIADRAAQRWQTWLSCPPRASAADCGRSFVARLGPRAYRRPLATAEAATLERAFLAGHALDGMRGALRAVLEVVLQSPQFLYRLELGARGPELTDRELAARLSYLFTGSMPDAALEAAASAGSLRQPGQLRAHAERLLMGADGRATLARFHRQWLDLDRLEGAYREHKLYPQWTARTPAAALAGTLAFLEHVWLDSESGTLEELFTADYAFVSAETAPLLGVPAAAAPGATRVLLDRRQRAGLLTDPGILVAFASHEAAAPISRGLFVRERLLCQPVNAPPDDLMVVPPEPDPRLTTRQLLEEHRLSGTCGRCHRMIDEIGLGLESYDSIGRFRTTQNGQPIDASGQITGTSDADGPFVGAVELAQRLARSAQVRSCLVAHWFRFAFGHAETAADAPTLADLQRRFVAGGLRLRELLLATVETPAFRTREDRGLNPSRR